MNTGNIPSEILTTEFQGAFIILIPPYNESG